MPPLTWAASVALVTFAVAVATTACAGDTAPTPERSPTAWHEQQPSGENSTPVRLIPGITPLVVHPVTRSPAPPANQSAPRPTPRPPTTTGPHAARATIAPQPTAQAAPAAAPTPIILTARGDRDRSDMPKSVDAIPLEHQIQAGEIDDNEDWTEYPEYAANYDGNPVRRTRLAERYLIAVKDSARRPVHSAYVTIYYEDSGHTVSLRTHADGRALHHPQDVADTGTLTISVLRSTLGHATKVQRSPQGQLVEILFPELADPPESLELDILFLMDVTGSMADEIALIKQTLVSIGRQITGLPRNPDLRTAMVAYRDRNDEFVTRIFDFDSDIERFLDTVWHIEAEGGTDYPESLNQALHEALNDASWRRNSVKLVFLLANAPLHLDYPQDEDYVREMARAQNTATKIFAGASSGLDAQGEYIFRQLAQQTMGKFVFIPYETGPQGELTTPHGADDDYSVENLDRLIVRLTTEELAALAPPQAVGARIPPHRVALTLAASPTAKSADVHQPIRHGGRSQRPCRPHGTGF